MSVAEITRDAASSPGSSPRRALTTGLVLTVTLVASEALAVATIMPAMVRDIDGVEFVGWSFAIYEIGSIIAGAATGRLVSLVSLLLPVSSNCGASERTPFSARQ